MDPNVNWEAVGSIAELLGAVGVILSLVYLALQIRQNSTLLLQNTSIARANAAVTSASYGSEFVCTLALDAEASRIWNLGSSDPGRLSEDELQRFDLLLIAQLIQMDVNLMLLKSGTLDREVHEIWERLLEAQLSHPRFQQLWQSGQIRRVTTASFSERVHQKLEALVEAGEPR